MKQKLNSNLLISFNIIFALFLFLSPLTAKAQFNHSVHANVGIQLKLGNLALMPTRDAVISGLDYSGDDFKAISTTDLKNNGSLKGKVAYKISVIDKTSGEPTNDRSKIKVVLKANTKKKLEPDVSQTVTSTSDRKY